MAHIADTNLRFSGATNPVTNDYTCGSGATLLVIGVVSTRLVETVAPTYNSIALTQADETRRHRAVQGDDPFIQGETACQLWYLTDPPTGSSLEISVPNPLSQPIHIQVSSYIVIAGKPVR